MKQTITFLRLAGIICLLAFIVMKLVNILPGIATTLLVFSVTCFALIILLQLYYQYITRYNRAAKEETENG
ncbi:MAG: hypothetical protein WAT19_11775 [Ferruginibacter sp.]